MTAGIYSCGPKLPSSTNYGLYSTSWPLILYPGEVARSEFPPKFSVSKLSAAAAIQSTGDTSSIKTYTDFSGAVKLSAASDSSCKNAAAGTLTATTNPVTFSSGVATFAGTKFSFSSTSTLEGKIYLKGTVTKDDTSYCTVAIPVIQHFNAGFGFVTSGGTGAAGTSTTATINDQARAVRINSNGLYVVAGTSKNSSAGTEAALWRYFQNGSLDKEFGTSGRVHFGTTGAAGATGSIVSDQVYGLAIDSDGNYLLTGSSINSTTSGQTMAVWKYKGDGTLDQTFAGKGYIVSSDLSSITGTLGLTGVNTAGNLRDVGRSILVDSDKKIVVAGSSVNTAGGTEMVVVRLLSTGLPDTNFGTNGVFHSGTAGAAGALGANTFDQGRSLQVNSSGSYYVGGSSANSAGGTQLAVWSVTKTGTLNTDWIKPTGIYVSSFTGAAGATGANVYDVANSIIFDQKGNLVAAGSSVNANGGTELALWRLKSTGLDSTFGTNGIVHSGSPGLAGADASLQVDIGNGVVQDVSEFATYPNASDISDSQIRYTVTGTSVNTVAGTELGMWRYLGTGKLDSAFNTNGYVHFGHTGSAGAIDAATLDRTAAIVGDGLDTTIVVGSSANADGGTDMAVWRFLTVGAPDV